MTQRKHVVRVETTQGDFVELVFPNAYCANTFAAIVWTTMRETGCKNLAKLPISISQLSQPE